MRHFPLTKKMILIVCVATLLLTAGTAALILRPRPLIPTDSRNELASTVFVPKGEGSVIDKKSTEYDKSNNVLRFKTHYRGETLTFNEQTVPQNFVDFPDTFTKFVNGLGSYASFGSSEGTVYLTKPVALNSNQAAVMSSKGTLLFVRSDTELSTDTWKQIFNILQTAN